MDPYQVLLLDPPWKYAARIPHKPRADGTKRTRFCEGAEGHYPCMPDKQLLLLRDALDWVADRNCALFLWATGPKLPLAIECLTSWGFRYATTAFYWIKTTKKARDYFERIEPSPGWGKNWASLMRHLPVKAPGYYTASCAEVVLLGVRGSMPPAEKLLSSTILAPRSHHSAKPEAVQDTIERMYPEARKLELFARRPREGWDCTGLDLDGLDVREALLRRSK